MAGLGALKTTTTPTTTGTRSILGAMLLTSLLGLCLTGAGVDLLLRLGLSLPRFRLLVQAEFRLSQSTSLLLPRDLTLPSLRTLADPRALGLTLSMICLLGCQPHLPRPKRPPKTPAATDLRLRPLTAGPADTATTTITDEGEAAADAADVTAASTAAAATMMGPDSAMAASGTTAPGAVASATDTAGRLRST